MSKRQESADKAKTFAFDASMNVLAASSLLDAYSVPSVAFVTYSLSLAEALFSTFFQLVKGPTLGYSNFQGRYTPLLYAWLPSSTEHLLSWRGIKRIFLSSFLGIYRFASMLSRRRNVGIPKIRI